MPGVPAPVRAQEIGDPGLVLLPGVPAPVREQEIGDPGLFFLPGVPTPVRAQVIGNPGLFLLAWGSCSSESAGNWQPRTFKLRAMLPSFQVTMIVAKELSARSSSVFLQFTLK